MAHLFNDGQECANALFKLFSFEGKLVPALFQSLFFLLNSCFINNNYMLDGFVVLFNKG